MVSLHDAGESGFGQRKVKGGAVAKVGSKRGERRVGEKDGVVRDVGFEPESFEMGLDVKGCLERGRCAGEVGLEGEVAEVGGEGVVTGRRKEDVLVVKGMRPVVLVKLV